MQSLRITVALLSLLLLGITNTHAQTNPCYGNPQMTGGVCVGATLNWGSNASNCNTCTYSWNVTSFQGHTVLSGGTNSNPNISLSFNHNFTGIDYAQVICTYTDTAGTYCTGGWTTDAIDISVFGNKQLSDPVLINGPYDGDTSKTWIYVRLLNASIPFFDYSSRSYSVQGGTLDSVNTFPWVSNTIEEDTLYIRWNNVANRQINCGGSLTGSQWVGNTWPQTCSNYTEAIPAETLNPAIPIGPALLCPGDTGVYYTTPIATATYTWTVVGGTILNGQGTDQVEVEWNSIPGTITISRDISGTISTNTLTLGPNFAPVNPNPLPVDTNFCVGTPLVLDAGGADSWLWSTGDTTQSITVNDSGMYSVAVTHLTCGTTTTVYDTIQAYRKVPIVPDLGPDSTFCNSDPYVDSVYGGFSAVYWNNSSVNNPTFSTYFGGTYWVNTIDTNGCSATDTIALTHLSYPSTYISGGTILCTGDTLTLGGGATNSQYLWSTGDTTYSISVTTPGQYWLRGGSVGCYRYDTTDIVAVNTPVVNLLTDSTFCSGDSVFLDAGNPGNNYWWSTGELTQTVTIDTPGLIYVIVSDSGCTDSDSITLIEVTDCVWPGDCNADGVADNADVLALGTVFAQVGPARPNASLNWVGQEATDWATNVTPTANTKHCDTDGSGVTTADDTLAITQNFGLTHSKAGSVNADNMLNLVAESDTAIAGDTVYFQVVLGDVLNPVDSVYGLAFTVHYDTSMVDQNGLLFVDYSNSVLSGGAQLLTVSRDFPTQSLADLVVSRTTQTDTAVQGPIARLGFVLTANLNGPSSLPFNVSLSDPILVNHQLVNQSLGANNDSIVVLQEPLALVDRWDNSRLELRPNPADDRVELSILRHRIVGWKIYDLHGGLIGEGSELDQERLILPTGELAEGVYLVRVKDETGRILTRKLTVMR